MRDANSRRVSQEAYVATWAAAHEAANAAAVNDTRENIAIPKDAQKALVAGFSAHPDTQLELFVRAAQIACLAHAPSTHALLVHMMMCL